MREKIAVVQLAREPGYRYFLRGGGVWRIPLLSDGSVDPAAQAQLIVPEAFEREGGYSYSLDVDGSIYRKSTLDGADWRAAGGGQRVGGAASTSGETLRALSIKQPWVELILRGVKDIENRSRRTWHRGPLLLHASATRDGEVDALIQEHGLPTTLPFGALVGVVDVDDCVESHASEWFNGPFGYVVKNPRRFRAPIPFKGAAAFFLVPVLQVQHALAECMSSEGA